MDGAETSEEKEVLEHIGRGLVYVQLAEQSLRFALQLAAPRKVESLRDALYTESFVSEMDKATLGTVVGKYIQLFQIEQSLEADLKRLVAERNRFVHHIHRLFGSPAEERYNHAELVESLVEFQCRAMSLYSFAAGLINSIQNLPDTLSPVAKLEVASKGALVPKHPQPTQISLESPEAE